MADEGPLNWKVTVLFGIAPPLELVSVAVNDTVCPADAVLGEATRLRFWTGAVCQVKVKALETVPEKVVRFWPAYAGKLKVATPAEVVVVVSCP
jgi:hypothetical protein